MSKKSNHRLTHGSRTRRVLRAAVTIGTVTTIFCGTYPFTAQAAITSGPEVEALKQLKMDYVANVDLNNWPALYQQFTPNALIDASDSLPCGLGPVFDGQDQFIAFNTLVVHFKLGVNAWGWSAWPQCGAASPRPPAQGHRG